MKKTALIIIMLTIPAIISAGEIYTTKGHYPYAATKENLKTLQNLLIQKDFVAAERFIGAGGGGILKAGVKVYVMERTWGGLVKIRPVGMTYTAWTVMEAVSE